MDGSAVEHSDSDSGESWTLLEGGPAYADDAPDFVEHPDNAEGLVADNVEKDEDTDGISIISDSEPESSSPCELTYDKCLIEESRPAEPQIPEFVSLSPPPLNNNDDQGSVRGDEDFLGDNGGKLKTYVHRRNKRLSTMLNIIVLGSVITAAGVAVGHMWGARHDCAPAAAPSVNKILSNLYKLQEENAHLRAKLRELTLLANMPRRAPPAPPDHAAGHKCGKAFDEAPDDLLRCVNADSPMTEHAFEKELLADLDKLKNVYQQNKSWLDDEIARRLKQEELYVKKTKTTKLKSMKSTKVNQEFINTKTDNTTKRPEPESPINTETVINVTEPQVPPVPAENLPDGAPDKRVTYADSLKSGHKVAKRDIGDAGVEYKSKCHSRKRKPPKEFDTISEMSMTDDELKKDDRYVGHRYRLDRGKKNDRPKTHKKQKRRNKYEQWEMKGGYLKDYDELSVPSAPDVGFTLSNLDKDHFSREFERNNYIEQFVDAGDARKGDAGKPQRKGARPERGPPADKELSWYDKRAALRGEARRHLEREMFSGATPPPAHWYFRRMARREQCRAGAEPGPAPARADNHTHKRLSKRFHNYKTKH